jgi:hypothetical protein
MTTAEEVREMIPAETWRTHAICVGTTGLSIHHPAFINVNFDEKFDVKENSYHVEIRNKRVSIDLYKESKTMHITVFN